MHITVTVCMDGNILRTNVIVLALLERLIRDTPIECHCLLALASGFSIVISSLALSQRSFSTCPTPIIHLFHPLENLHRHTMIMQRCIMGFCASRILVVYSR